MTQDEIIEMAIEAELAYDIDAVFTFKGNFAQIEAFAKLVAAKEREACAKECWKQMGLLPTQAWSVNPYEQCINAIRSRGKA